MQQLLDLSPHRFRNYFEFTHEEFSCRYYQPLDGISDLGRCLRKDPAAAGLGFTVLPEGAFQKYAETKKLSVVKLKNKIADEIYRVQRGHEKLPSRYQTIESKLKSK